MRANQKPFLLLDSATLGSHGPPQACLTPPTGVLALATTNGYPRPWKARKEGRSLTVLGPTRGSSRFGRVSKTSQNRQQHVQNGSSAPLYLLAEAKNNKAWHLLSSLAMYSQKFAEKFIVVSALCFASPAACCWCRVSCCLFLEMKSFCLLKYSQSRIAHANSMQGDENQDQSMKGCSVNSER